VAASQAEELQSSSWQDRLNQLIRAYRMRGHMIANLHPIGPPPPAPPELDPTYFGFTEADMNRLFACETLQCQGPLRLAQILERLRNTYCRSIGVQYMHIDSLAERRWLQARMEGTENRIQLTRQEQLRILTRLTDAAIFEEFIRKKFIGAKSFSLEGCESLIPLLDLAIDNAGEQGIDEIVMGMGHRGRLNVLANIIGKSPQEIFREFADADPDRFIGRGDVKYHLGYSSNWKTSSDRTVHLSLCFNPSHLEFVNPVVLGRTRAKQDRAGDSERARGLALLIHGDAAFAGEGMVQETLNLSQLNAYKVGGTLHIIVNNQIGFTTSPSEGRSCMYATDIARMLQVPIFHVNGEDPEAVAQVVRLAMEYRQKFKRDVVVDMYGYRRLGHNEGDEPSFTHPVLYRAIEQRKSVREGYLDHLLTLKGLTREEADAIALQRREQLEKALSESASKDYRPPASELRGIWSGYRGGRESEVEEVATMVDRQRLTGLLQTQLKLPPNFNLHPKLKKLFQARSQMAEGKQPLDWAAGEALAFATLATEGYRVRLTGQDSQRGTFSHRHAMLRDYETGHPYMPLQNLAPDQSPVEIYNSPLSEAGVLGFEYGYSLDCPDGLVMWEAQFGDFINAAQVIIDQFIISAEDKWRRLSGLVLLLPHGYEGQGPEHSSARFERFLALAADDNIQVIYPTTPAQFFHALRRQVLRRWRKPMVVLTPKSLLRHPNAVSEIELFAQGRFQKVIQDSAPEAAGKEIKRVLLCTGKIYYELHQRRTELQRNDIAIVRLEQLYPLPNAELQQALAVYREGTLVVWVQEEPENMGAWRYLRIQFLERLLDRFPFRGVYRPAAASPATGSYSSHKKEQETLLNQAFDV